MKAVRRLGFTLLYTVLAVFISCGESERAARVGNHVISMDDVLKVAQERSRSNAPFTYGYLFSVTNDLVDLELAAYDARRQKMDELPEIKSQVEEFRDGQVYMEVINRFVIDKIVTDKMLKERYKQLQKEYRLRHIYLSKKNRNAEQAFAELNRLRSSLLRNASFEALAREVSEDSLTAGKGGDLGFVKWGNRGWGDSFYKTASRLRRGQISKPIESDRGYHLIKLEEVRPAQQPSYKSMKDELRRGFYKSEGARLDSAYYAFVSKIEKHYNVVYPEGTPDSLLLFVVNGLRRGIDAKSNPFRFLDSLTAEQRALPLAVYRGGQFTIEDAIKAYEKISPRLRPLLNNQKEIKTFMSRNIPRRLIIRYGYEKGFDKHRDVIRAMRDQEVKLLADKIRRTKIYDSLALSDEQVEQFYKENSRLFEKGAQVEIQKIFVKDEVFAWELYERLQAGADFAQLAAKYPPESDEENQTGGTEWVSTDVRGIIPRTAARMKVGEFSKPLKTSDGFVLIKILDRKDGVLEEFSPILARKARREMRSALSSEMEKRWLEELKKVVPVAVNKSALIKEAARAKAI